MIDLLQTHDYIAGKAKALMMAKNFDYTSGSGDPFSNFKGSQLFGIHPVIGMQLRQQDKMQRVKTFVEKGELKVKGEQVLDAIVDQINYLVLQYGYIIQQQQDKEKKQTHGEPEQLELEFPGRPIHAMEQRRLSSLQEDVCPSTRGNQR